MSYETGITEGELIAILISKEIRHIEALNKLKNHHAQFQMTTFQMARRFQN